MHHRYRAQIAPLLLATLVAALACESAVGPDERLTDRTPPAVVLTEPLAGAVGVDSTATIAVTFDQPMAAATVRPGATFRVSVQSVPIPGVVVVGDPEQRRFVFVPAAALPGSRQVDVLVRDVAGAAGNWLASPYGFSFRTGGPSPVPPRVPANPYPGAGATNVPNDTTFTWTGGTDGGDPVVYDFWLGTNAGNLTQRAADLTVTAYGPGPLPYATAHAWKVVARSPGGTTEGPVWAFTTEDEPPPAPCNPYPADLAVDVPDTTRFEWGCIADPDGDPLSFDVYLGTTSPPALVATVTSPLFGPLVPLAAETSYYWRIVADDGRGGRTEGRLWTFVTAAAPPPNEPPSMPSSPDPPDQAAAVPTGTALAWSGGVDPDGDPVEFVVFRERDDPADPDSVAVVRGRSYTPASPLEPGAVYYWRIEARDSRGAATSGLVWSFTTNAPPSLPCAPDPADGETGVGIVVRLNWACGVDPEGQAVAFDVYFGTTPDPAGPIDTVTSPTYLVGGVEPGLIYYWRIVARDALDAETPGPVWWFSTGPANVPPLAPCNPYPADEATGVADTTRFQWGCTSDPDGDQVSFEVYLGTSVNPPLVATVATPLYVPPAPLAAETSYYWRIVVDDGHGGRTAGLLWTIETAAPANLPPSDLVFPAPPEDAIGIGADVTLTWNGGDDTDPVIYVVFFENGDAADPDSVAAVAVKSYAPAIPLEPGGDYYWRIEARDARGAVSRGSIWHFRANLPPDAPCDPTPDDGGTGIGSAVRLRWRCGTDPEEQDVLYDVYLGMNPDPPGPVATVGNRNALVEGLIPARTYYWRIVARDPAGGQTTGPVWSFSTSGQAASGNPGPRR